MTYTWVLCTTLCTTKLDIAHPVLAGELKAATLIPDYLSHSDLLSVTS